MKREYEIQSYGKCVGKAYVTPAGLYFDIDCRCKLQDSIVRIIANCGQTQENIGICVPMNGEMVLRTKIPQKRLQTLLGFEAICEVQEEWVPIAYGEPIPCLCRIIDAKFQYRNGKPGLSIRQAKPYKNR